ncbi:ATPase [Actinomadura rubrisoli]|uniref:ATPase n=1 Tax=Actinomadura rubrisoli TaxID=2530368 RepID=A0A4R4ZLX0_9ACTN|nr:ATPase [Actinomadura rubrisoli]
MKRFILTGTPGSGKTSVLRALADRGYDVVDEAATAVITQAQERGEAEPWSQASFIDEVVGLQRQRQTRASSTATGIQVYDRSPICTHALSVYLQRPILAALSLELNRIAHEQIYERQVFFVRNLGFCEPTAARRISFKDSLDFERIHEESYRNFGYELVDIPAGKLIDRVDMVENSISRFVLRTPSGGENGAHLRSQGTSEDQHSQE